MFNNNRHTAGGRRALSICCAGPVCFKAAVLSYLKPFFVCFFGLTRVIGALAEIESVVITGIEEVKRLSSNDKQMAGTGETVDTQWPHTAWAPFTCNGQN